jgi:hypothetical protein
LLPPSTQQDVVPAIKGSPCPLPPQFATHRIPWEGIRNSDALRRVGQSPSQPDDCSDNALLQRSGGTVWSGQCVFGDCKKNETLAGIAVPRSTLFYALPPDPPQDANLRRLIKFLSHAELRDEPASPHRVPQGLGSRQLPLCASHPKLTLNPISPVANPCCNHQCIIPAHKAP